MRTLFVTGTDTGVGKSWVSRALIKTATEMGCRVGVMKPVAAGCVVHDGTWQNDDVDVLCSATPLTTDPDLTCPFPLIEPLSPNIAASLEGREITVAPIVDAHRQLQHGVDLVIVEGVGGWSVPLSESLMQADLVAALQADVVLVCGMRLGWLNHSLLSAQQILRDGGRLKGWIANRIDPAMEQPEANLQTLERLMPVPLYAELGWENRCSAALKVVFQT